MTGDVTMLTSSNGSEGGSAGRRIRVAFQGAAGAFSEEAAIGLFGDSAEYVPCERFTDVGALLAGGVVTHGVLPLENAIAGPVHASLAVLAHYSFTEVCRVDHPIRMFLLGTPDAVLDDVRRVISHPVALQQCGMFLGRLSRAVATPFFDTAGAAREVALRGTRELASISPPATAARFGLRVLACDVHDRQDNFTRFALVVA